MSVARITRTRKVYDKKALLESGTDVGYNGIDL